MTETPHSQPDKGEAAKPTKGLALPEPEPWSEPVHGATLLDEVTVAIRSYVVMDAGSYDAVTLWIVHAHAFDAFSISPRLAITSPEKGCGKTTMLDVVAALVPKPLMVANVTSAAVFRTIEVCRPTLLVDEADTFLAKSDELRGILNSGHRKSSANVIRLVGETHDTKVFSTWCPVAIAAIGKVPGTLADRSIQIRLRRRLPTEAVKSFRAGRTPELSVLAQKIARWVSDHRDELGSADPEMPDGLFNRQADNWAPLLAIADAAGGEWPGWARERALAMTASSNEEQLSATVLLLADVRDIFDKWPKKDRIASGLIVNKLVDLEDRPWVTWSHGKPMTQNNLARMLHPYGIRPANMKPEPGNNIVLKGYSRSQFEDVWARYLPDRRPLS